MADWPRSSNEPPAEPTPAPAATPPRQIGSLPALMAALPERERTLAARLFMVAEAHGEIVPPPEMLPWLEKTFGSVEATRWQHIIRVLNRWTREGATFNPLRSRRPGSGTTHGASAVPEELRERIARTVGDDFCDPEHHTPADSFGRVRGRHVITAANVAKADGWHSVGIFDRHDPLAIDDALVADVLAVAGAWAARAHAADPLARHFFLLWNCLPRAGASLIHGHVQMTLSRDMPHAGVERWRNAAREYQAAHGANYFADLRSVQAALDLSVPLGNSNSAVVALPSLTPAKEREIVLLDPSPGRSPTGRGEMLLAPEEEMLGALAGPLAAVLRAARAAMGVLSFNVALFGPPLGALSAEERAAWAGFPLLARFVDRGNPLAPTSDIAGLELFGSSVISADPFDVASALREVAPR